MDFLAEIAQTRGEHELNLRVHILNALLDGELAAVDGIAYVGQSRKQLLQLIGLQQTYRLEHADMRHGALHVVAGQTQVELPVVSHSEFLNHFVRLEAFVPKFHRFLIISERLRISLR